MLLLLLLIGVVLMLYVTWLYDLCLFIDCSVLIKFKLFLFVDGASGIELGG